MLIVLNPSHYLLLACKHSSHTTQSSVRFVRELRK